MPSEIISFKIQPARSVVRDILENRKWIVRITLVIIFYAAISTVVFHALEGIQQIDGHVRINDW